MRILPSLLVLVLATPLLADEPKVHKGIPYSEPKNERQMLDVYTPTKGKDLPVVLWIHGGGWRAGDKANVQKKPQAFVDKGYVFVATNHRFFPNVTVKEMTGDIAKAIRWIHDHAKDYGGDPNSIFVMGHSSGAHLAALVCTDDRYLKAEGLPLSIIKGCVPVDVSVYDIPKRLKEGGFVATATFTKTFGEKEESQRDYSPAWHVAKGKSIPPFLILHVADRAETKVQAHWLADKLKEAGIAAKVVAAEGTNHGTIGRMREASQAQPFDARTFTDAARQYISLLRQHIFKENNVLFRMAERVMSEADDADVTSRFSQVEQERGLAGWHESFKSEVAGWEKSPK